MHNDVTVFRVYAFFHFILTIRWVANHHFVGPSCFLTRLMITCPVMIVSTETIQKKKRDYNGKSRAWGGLPGLGWCCQRCQHEH